MRCNKCNEYVPEGLGINNCPSCGGELGEGRFTGEIKPIEKEPVSTNIKETARIEVFQGMTIDELNNELQRGGRFVVFQYCISIVVMTFRRGSSISFIRAGESTIKHSIGYTLLTFFLGWWGIPWGPIYTIGALFTNLTGGKDVTQELINSWNNKN